MDEERGSVHIAFGNPGVDYIHADTREGLRKAHLRVGAVRRGSGAFGLNIENVGMRRF